MEYSCELNICNDVMKLCDVSRKYEPEKTKEI